MTVSVASLEPFVRSLIGDYSITGRDVFTYTSSTTFTLSESNVVSIDSVSRNDVSSGVSYSFDSTRNKITIDSGLTTGDVVEIQYTMYNDFSSNEIQQYIRAAVSHVVVNKYAMYTVQDIGSTASILPSPDDREQQLISLVAAILIKPDNRSYRLPDVTISLQSKDLPTDQKIRREDSELLHRGEAAIFSSRLHRRGGRRRGDLLEPEGR